MSTIRKNQTRNPLAMIGKNTVFTEEVIENLSNQERTSNIAKIYWPIISILSVLYSSITKNWNQSWIIWPIASFIFIALSGYANTKEQQ